MPLGGAGARRRPDPRVHPKDMGERLLGAIERSSWVPFALLFLGYSAYQVRLHHADFGQWDVLLLSGWATLAAGLAFTQTVPRRLERTLHQCSSNVSTD